MACSTARPEANRRNAQQSTGPWTAAGKAASRLNAFRHGLAGDGDAVGPGEDVALIEQRAAAFAREFAAEGEAGRLMASRAAVLSVRIERAMMQDFAKVGVDVAAAREQFDADRRAMIAGRIAELDEAAAPCPALDDLEATVEGQAHLAQVRLDLYGRVEAGDAGAVARARTCLDRPGLAGSPASATLADRIVNEAERLLALIDATGAEALDRVAAARDLAGVLASFDPPPDAQHTRRYEADAERGMSRAVRSLRQLRADRLGPERPDRPPAAPHPGPATGPGSPAARRAGPELGSFRAGPEDLGSFRIESSTPPAEPAASSAGTAAEPR